MSTPLIVSYLALWAIVIALTLLVLLMYRQFGLLIMPGRLRASLAGLDTGAHVPTLAFDTPQVTP